MLIESVTAKNIKPVTAKVLIYLCAVVDYGNVVNKGSDQIAKELGYSIRNIQRALLELEEMKIIIPSSSRFIFTVSADLADVLGDRRRSNCGLHSGSERVLGQ